MKATTVAQVVAAEAGGKTRAQRLQAMKDVFSAVYNRAMQTGQSFEDVVSAVKNGKKQFSAYDAAMPAGTPGLVDLAQEAIDSVLSEGPTHPGTYYARSYATGNLPSGLQEVGTSVDDHVYYTDPQNRPIVTAAGTFPVNPSQQFAPGLQPASFAPQSTTQAPPQSLSGLGAGSIVPSANAGPAGQLYSDLVAPQSVQTTRVTPGGLGAQTPGPGMAALAPHGLIGDKTIAGYDKSELDPSIGGVLNSLGADPRFASVTVESGYRTPEENKAAKGAKNSQHLYHKAADLGINSLPDDQKAALLDKALTQGVKGVGLYPSGALHIDTRNNPTFWGPAGYGYNAAPVSAAQAWARPMLSDLMTGNVYTPQVPSNIPTPTPRPEQAQPMVAQNPYENMGLAAAQPVQPSQSFAPGLQPASFMPDQGLGSVPPDLQQPETTAPGGLGALPPSPTVAPVQAPSIQPSQATETVTGTEINVPEQQTHLLDPTSLGGVSSFPAQPEAPQPKEQSKVGKALKRAALGYMVGGPVGAALGLGSTMMPDGLGSDLFSQPDVSRFSIGNGLGAMQQAMSGARGATAYSRSNPGYSYTSLGNGTGIRSGPFGWQTVDASGSPTSDIRDKNGRRKGFFDAIGDALGLGGNDGGGFSDRERSDWSGRVGLF